MPRNLAKLKRLKPLRKREKPFEYRLRAELKKLGIIFTKCKPTIKGWPDRLAVGHYGEMLLVELKRDDEPLSIAQKIVHEDLKYSHGVIVQVVRSSWGIARAARVIASLVT